MYYLKNIDSNIAFQTNSRSEHIFLIMQKHKYFPQKMIDLEMLNI